MKMKLCAKCWEKHILNVSDRKLCDFCKGEPDLGFELVE